MFLIFVLSQRFNCKKGKTVKNWYNKMNKGQKVFVYMVSTALVIIYGIGLLPLAILIYLELGEREAAN